MSVLEVLFIRGIRKIRSAWNALRLLGHNPDNPVVDNTNTRPLTSDASSTAPFDQGEGKIINRDDTDPAPQHADFKIRLQMDEIAAAYRPPFGA